MGCKLQIVRIERFFVLRRKAFDEISEWKRLKTKQALLVAGVRQAGKTFLIREFVRSNYEYAAEINFVESPEAAEAFSSAKNAEALFLRIAAFSVGELVPKKTAVFIDEVQECENIVTMIKYLVEKYGEDYDFILSGSLLGVELKGVRSVPVGYLKVIQMYPLDFEEYCWAKGVPGLVLEEVRAAFAEGRAVDEYAHARMMDVFHEYLLIGGMPDVVQAYCLSSNLQQARSLQGDIVNLYRQDISKYAADRARVVRKIFDLIPAELNSQGKRFALSHIEGESRFSKYDNDFAWLVDAGVALPAYNVSAPAYPLELEADSSFFKLFLSDTGLLTYLCGMDVVRSLLGNRPDINFGSIYENYVAQEMTAQGLCHPVPAFHLFFYRGRKVGELDFLYEANGRVVPVEVKSGKSYKRHSALSAVLKIGNYGMESAVVLHEGNVEIESPIAYLPMYMTMLLGSGFPSVG